mgnify:CR=1 FL=1
MGLVDEVCGVDESLVDRVWVEDNREGEAFLSEGQADVLGERLMCSKVRSASSKGCERAGGGVTDQGQRGLPISVKFAGLVDNPARDTAERLPSLAHPFADLFWRFHCRFPASNGARIDIELP